MDNLILVLVSLRRGMEAVRDPFVQGWLAAHNPLYKPLPDPKTLRSRLDILATISVREGLAKLPKDIKVSIVVDR